MVTTDRGAIRETVTDGRDGFVLPDPEPALLAERVVRLLEDPALLDDFSRAATRCVRGPPHAGSCG